MHRELARIPVAGPWITQLEVDYAADAAANGWYDRAGEYPRRFEESFANVIGVRHAIAVPHCTAAIHLALAALDVGAGDTVIVPDVTWIASAAPIEYVGAHPKFVDIDPDTWCIDATSLEQAITPDVSAIIAVDLYGSMPDFVTIRDIADRHGVPIIEDAAEATGSRIGDQSAGSFGRVGVFSFHGSKTLATGEGGMLVTDDDDLAARVQVLRDHGRRPGDKMFLNEEVAFKYKMSPVQAALGLAQTERLAELVDRKRMIFSWYAEELAEISEIRLNHEPTGVTNSFWMTTAIVDSATGWQSRELVNALADLGIDSRPFFSPLSSLKAYRSHSDTAGAPERNPVSYDISSRGVNLPSALMLDRKDVSYVADMLKRLVKEGP